jgi:hypothetical protein
VLVQPPRTTFAKILAQYATTAEKVMVRPAQTIPHHHPAITKTVSERILVQPASKVWTVTRDAHGAEVGCWVEKPAVYSTQLRTVVVQPATTSYTTIPAEYRTIHRQVVVSPERLIAQTSPAVYATQYYQAQIAPATTSWQPIGHYGRHARGAYAGHGNARHAGMTTGHRHHAQRHQRHAHHSHAGQGSRGYGRH